MGRQKVYNADFRCNLCGFHLELRGIEERLSNASNVLAKHHKDYSPSCDAQVKDFSAKILVRENKYAIDAKDLLIKRREETESLLENKKFRLDDIIGSYYAKKIIQTRLIDYIIYKTRMQQMRKYPGSGIVLAGIQGTGKSEILCAAVNDIILSNEAYREKFDVVIMKCHDFMSGTVGDSGKKVESILDAIRESNKEFKKETVLIIDEIDNLAPDRNTRSVLTAERTGSILDEFGGIHDDHTIFFMGTTNRPDKIASEALVAGRLGNPILVNIPTEEERFELFTKFTKGSINLDLDINSEFINSVIGKFTGRDIYYFTNDLQTIYFKKEAESKKKLNGEKDENSSFITITRNDIITLSSSPNYRNTNMYNMQSMKILSNYYSQYNETVEGLTEKEKDTLAIKDIELSFGKD